MWSDLLEENYQNCFCAGYYHDNFVRGQKGLCQHIVRRQIKGTLTRKPVLASEPDFYRSDMIRCTNTDKMQLVGRQHDITNSTSQSDHMMNARVGQPNTRTYAMPAPPSMFTNILVTKPEFSNTEGNPGAMGRQLHSKMTFADLQGLSTQCLMAAMGAATKFQQVSNGSSVPRFNHATSSETHNPAPGCYNTGNESVVTMPCPPRYATCHKTNMQDFNSGSVVATDFDNPRYETFSTSFFSGPVITDAPAIDETFDSATASNTFFNECNHFERMPPQKAFYQY
jgi:hypothetical protein